MKSSSEAKLLLIMGLFVLLGGGALVAMNRGGGGPIPGVIPTPPPTPVPVAWTDQRFQELVKDAKHVRGPENAPFTIVEFADFECPSCRRAYNSVFPELEGKVPVRFVFHHYPLDMHPHAKPAAEATEAASRQGKFWPMFDALFKGEEATLDDAFITESAKHAGLDMAKFDKDRADASIQTPVSTDIALAGTSNVTMTPTAIIRDNKTGKFYQAAGSTEIATVLAKLTGLKFALPSPASTPAPGLASTPEPVPSAHGG